jgi:hypothetical protein
MKMKSDRTGERAFLGVGLQFPVAIDAAGELSTAVYEDDVHQAIILILGTNPGERIMRPDFGAGLNRFVFEPITATTTHAIETRVSEALIDWEARIDVLEVTVTADRSTRNQLLITIRYRIRATNTLHNLVYPFYLLEGDRA